MKCLDLVYIRGKNGIYFLEIANTRNMSAECESALMSRGGFVFRRLDEETPRRYCRRLPDKHKYELFKLFIRQLRKKSVSTDMRLSTMIEHCLFCMLPLDPPFTSVANATEMDYEVRVKIG